MKILKKNMPKETNNKKVMYPYKILENQFHGNDDNQDYDDNTTVHRRAKNVLMQKECHHNKFEKEKEQWKILEDKNE